MQPSLACGADHLLQPTSPPPFRFDFTIPSPLTTIPSSSLPVVAVTSQEEEEVGVDKGEHRCGSQR